MRLTLYRIEELRSSRIWNAVDPTKPMDGGFEDGDDFVVEFEDEDEAYAFADQVEGVVAIHRQGTHGHSLGYVFATAAE